MFSYFLLHSYLGIVDLVTIISSVYSILNPLYLCWANSSITSGTSLLIFLLCFLLSILVFLTFFKRTQFFLYILCNLLLDILLFLNTRMKSLALSSNDFPIYIFSVRSSTMWSMCTCVRTVLF